MPEQSIILNTHVQIPQGYVQTEKSTITKDRKIIVEIFEIDMLIIFGANFSNSDDLGQHMPLGDPIKSFKKKVIAAATAGWSVVQQVSV